uniref:Arginine vasopressin-induced protein 1 n=1 Tax=Coturnix japonica TaxID=93934 RepID=A0A8C2YGH2_COTJA
MGTPASVASDPPGRAAPAAPGRKRGSANIFQGVGLPELRSLFLSGGAEKPEERARLVWRYAGQRRMARALRKLRRRRAARAQPTWLLSSSCRLLQPQPAHSTQSIKSQPQEQLSSSCSASPRQPSPAHSYHQVKKGFRLWKLCV